MEIARLVLSYIQTLIWPMVATFVIILLRQPIKGFLLRVQSVEAPGGWKATAEQSARDLTQEISGAAKGLADPRPDPDNLTPLDLRSRREALQTVISQTHEAGFLLAQTGQFSIPPQLKIEWTADGSPEIVGYVDRAKRGRPYLTPSEEAAAEKLQIQIARLDAQREQSLDSSPEALQRLDRARESLVSQLHSIDPLAQV